MTAERLADSGPRMILAQRFDGVVIFREGQSCFAGKGSMYLTVAKSYTLSYLLKIGRAMEKLQ